MDGAFVESVHSLRTRVDRQQRSAVFIKATLMFFVIVAGGASVYLLSEQQLVPTASTGAPASDSLSVPVMVDIVTPYSNIKAGTPLQASMFKIQSLNLQDVSPNTVHSIGEIQGMYAKLPLPLGAALTKDKITSVRPSNLVTASIPNGYRAVTIGVNATSAVEGWARAGARVDIAWTSRVRGEQGITLIQENVKILSAERQTENMPDQNGGNAQVAVPSTATLLIPEQEAAKIILAASAGSLTLSLRGDEDIKAATRPKTITYSDLLEKDVPLDKRSVGRKQGQVSVQGPDGRSTQYTLVDGSLSLSH